MFWAVPPAELHLAQAEAEKRGWTFTIGKESIGANISIVAHTTKDSEDGLLNRARLQIDILKDIQQHIPPFRATWSIDDGAPFHRQVIPPLLTVPVLRSQLLSFVGDERSRTASYRHRHPLSLLLRQPPTSLTDTVVRC